MRENSSEFIHGKINIKELIQKIKSKWYYFVFSLLVLIPLASAYIYFTQNVYLVRASILLDGEVKNGLNPGSFLKGMELMSSQTELEDEIGILKSYSLTENTVQKLDFGISYYAKSNFRSYEPTAKNFPFIIELDSTVNQIVGVPIYIERTSDSTFSVTASSGKAGTYNFYTNTAEETLQRFEVNDIGAANTFLAQRNLKFKVRFKSPVFYTTDTQFYFVINNLNSLAESYREKLEIKSVGRESNLVEVTVKTTNAEKGIVLLNTLLEVYRTNELIQKNDLGYKTIKFIDDQLGGVSNELRQVESSLETFRARNNILDINTTADNLTRNLDKLEEEKSVLERKLKYYRYIASSLDRESSLQSIGATSTFGFEDPLLNNLLMELARLNQERSGLNYSTKEGNPVAEVLELKIAGVKKTLVENVNNFIGASAQALADLNSKIYEVRRVVQGLPRSERELVNIKRQFDFNDNVYNYLLEKRAEAGIAIASNTVEKTIVDNAKQIGHGPIAPNKKIILLAAIMVSIIFSIGLIIFKDVLNDNIITIQDVEKNSNIPFIGIIAHGSKRELASSIVAHTKSAIGESFRSLRVNLQYLTLGKESNVIGVTSSVESEGKTFCSANLAVAMTQAGKRTVVIDSDLRRPQVANYFRLKNDKGLSSYLIGSCQLKEIITPTTIKGLDVITSGPIPPNPLDLIGLAKMEELIITLKQTYNTIIIDSPPIGFVSEYIILMKYTNANIYVVRSNYTNRFLLDKINRLYEDKKIKNVSILLNDYKASPNGYDYVYG
jgi:capsular exopolysaccharide synthesis family protein